jgi:hypothetical protein
MHRVGHGQHARRTADSARQADEAITLVGMQITQLWPCWLGSA